MVLRGEPGSGKTALLAAAEATAADRTDMTILRCIGTQDERDLPYAALHALVRPVRSLLSALVPAQRDAIDLALGVTGGGQPAPLLVGAALLSLLDMASTDNPVLVLVDDLQWIDSESRDAIGFAARRVQDDAVGLLLAIRADADVLSGIDCYDLPELGEDEAIELLAGHGVARSVALRLSEVAGGNPLALLEFATLLSVDQRRGAAPLPDPMPSTSPAAAYGGLIVGLPAAARRARRRRPQGGPPATATRAAGNDRATGHDRASGHRAHASDQRHAAGSTGGLLTPLSYPAAPGGRSHTRRPQRARQDPAVTGITLYLSTCATPLPALVTWTD